jgi:hypothetical protein
MIDITKIWGHWPGPAFQNLFNLLIIKHNNF